MSVNVKGFVVICSVEVDADVVSTVVIFSVVIGPVLVGWVELSIVVIIAEVDSIGDVSVVLDNSREVSVVDSEVRNVTVVSSGIVSISEDSLEIVKGGVVSTVVGTVVVITSLDASSGIIDVVSEGSEDEVEVEVSI